MTENYKDVLHKKLQPSLKKGLQTVATQQPADPIEFLASHMKESRINNEGQPEANNSEDREGRTANATLVSSNDESEIVQQELRKDERLRVDHWRKAKVVDAWTDLTRKYAGTVKWWTMAKSVRNAAKPNIQPVTNRKAWKTIRVFVSSTFRDMFCERDWLVKHVFPDLRNWCAERKLYLIECDLRWGVPKDSNSREILAACLNEIDRCREENTMPYFVGLLGHRYGWVPSEKDFPEDMRKQYCWIPGMSVTSLEVCTGSVWENNPHSIFMIRDDKIYNGVQKLAVEHSVDPDKILSGYRETDEEAVASLEMLKKLVRDAQSDDQIANYSCELSGLTPDGAGGHRLNLTGLRAFGDKVSEFLKSRIAQQFVSLSNETQSSMELQHAEHEQFMEQRGAVLFGRSKEVDMIKQYIDQPAREGTNVPVLIVSGSAGTGKSSLIAHVAQKCMDSESTKVVVHFVGATAGSTTLHRVITRLWYECLELAEKEIPTDFDELKRSLEVVFRRASELTKHKAIVKATAELGTETKVDAEASFNYGKLVIFLDAINQMDDEGDTLSLLWLPKELPFNVRLVVSTLEGTTLDALRVVNLPEVKVEPLTDDSRKFIVTEFFKTYNKKLADNEVQQLLSHADAGRPLWLSLACEELRVFGTFELLAQKIASLSGDLLGLVKQILERVISETTVGGDLMQAAMSLIRASRFGLVESELQQLLVIEPTLPPAAKLDCVINEREPFVAGIDKLPMQTWAVLYLSLHQFLRPVGSSGDGRLDFYHRSISKVIRATMLDDPTVSAAWHRRLADYFDTKVTSYHRKAEELPYHLLELKDFKKLEKTLLDDQMFDHLYKEDTKVQLLMFWRELGGYKVAARRYVNAFNNNWPQTWFPDKITKAEEQQETDREVKQWVESVSNYSSQYGDHSWSAACIVGPQRVFPEHGDDKRAWAPKEKGLCDFVELVFETPVFVTEIIIFETFHAGGIRTISVRNPEGQWHPIYQAQEICDIQSARKFKPKIESPPFKVNEVRIDTDGSACQDWIEIDAVRLIGRTVYNPQVGQENQVEDSSQPVVKESSKLSKQWVNNITGFSSQYGSPKWGAEKIVGPPTVYPKHGDFSSAWAPAQTGTSEFIQFQFERPVYVAAVCVFETYHAGGVRSISVLNEQDEQQQWQPIYQASEIVNLDKSRKFLPVITRPTFKCSQMRIDIDQSACNSWCELDAVALYGYDDLFQEDILPEELVKREYPDDLVEPVKEAEEDAEEFVLGPQEKTLITLSDEEFAKWLTIGVKLGGFLVDVGQFEIGEKHLVYVRNLVQAKYDVSDVKSERVATLHETVLKKYAEVFYVLVMLYRNWFTKFVHANNDESRRAQSRGRETGALCCEIHKRVYATDDLYYGEVVAACSFFIPGLRDEIVELFEAKNYKRGLVELYSLKGTQTQHQDLAVTRGYHEKAIKLAYSEFGKYHVKTARAHQLYGQMLWNRWTRNDDEKTMERMNELFVHYWTEYEIFENIFGPDHTLTIRSRADNIIVLGQLGREEEAQELSKKQPKGQDVIGN